MQTLYERIRGEAWENREPASWEYERVRHYGVASLFRGVAVERSFILYVHSVPRPPWSGKQDFHRERLRQTYTFLTHEVNHASSPLRSSIERETGEGTDDRVPVRRPAELC